MQQYHSLIASVCGAENRNHTSPQVNPSPDEFLCAPMVEIRTDIAVKLVSELLTPITDVRARPATAT